MKGLFVKDLCLMRELRKIIYIILFVSVVFVLNGTDSAFLTGYIVILTALLSGITISYDEMNGSLAFLMTLPITRRQYVAEKYLIGIFLVCGGAVYAFLVNMISAVVIADTANVEELVITTMIFGVTGILIFSFSLPIELKFGGEKGRIMMILGFMIVFCGGFLAVRLLERYSPEKKEAMMAWIVEAMSGTMIYPVCAAISIGVLGISFLISCRIMMKKEF